jgi:class 3 adenylate cyclase
VCEITGIDVTVLNDLTPPVILHYCGHRIDPSRTVSRFPPELEAHVDAEIRAFLAAHRVGFAFGSLASGADILTAEALFDAGISCEIVLPFDTEEFEQVSVAPAGIDWLVRFRACLARATSVVHASDSSFLNDHELFGYSARIAMGHALNRAAFLDAPVLQLAIWDRNQHRAAGGTAHDVAAWTAAGHPTHVIALPAQASPGTQPPGRRSSPREVAAILFGDFRGFSRLRDEHFPIFVEKVFAPLAAVLDNHSDAVWWRESRGDAIVAVFADVTTAADCALGFQEVLGRVDLEAIGLPADLELRIGAHVGPVMPIIDPVTGRSTYWGREMTRAARIEPRTPEGEVYVTDAFAALLALEPRSTFITEYVGRVTTGKDFETIPMYRLHRSSRSSPRKSP